MIAQATMLENEKVTNYAWNLYKVVICFGKGTIEICFSWVQSPWFWINLVSVGKGLKNNGLCEMTNKEREQEQEQERTPAMQAIDFHGIGMNEQMNEWVSE